MEYEGLGTQQRHQGPRLSHPPVEFPQHTYCSFLGLILGLKKISKQQPPHRLKLGSARMGCKGVFSVLFCYLGRHLFPEASSTIPHGHALASDRQMITRGASLFVRA